MQSLKQIRVKQEGLHLSTKNLLVGPLAGLPDPLPSAGRKHPLLSHWHKCRLTMPLGKEM